MKRIEAGSVLISTDPQIRIRKKRSGSGTPESINEYQEDISIFKQSLPVGKLTLVISPL
jgi:hypothetical protein